MDILSPGLIPWASDSCIRKSPTFISHRQRKFNMFMLKSLDFSKRNHFFLHFLLQRFLISLTTYFQIFELLSIPATKPLPEHLVNPAYTTSMTSPSSLVLPNTLLIIFQKVKCLSELQLRFSLFLFLSFPPLLPFISPFLSLSFPWQLLRNTKKFQMSWKPWLL